MSDDFSLNWLHVCFVFLITPTWSSHQTKDILTQSLIVCASFCLVQNVCVENLCRLEPRGENLVQWVLFWCFEGNRELLWKQTLQRIQDHKIWVESKKALGWSWTNKSDVLSWMIKNQTNIARNKNKNWISNSKRTLFKNKKQLFAKGRNKTDWLTATTLQPPQFNKANIGKHSPWTRFEFVLSVEFGEKILVLSAVQSIPSNWRLSGLFSVHSLFSFHLCQLLTFSIHVIACESALLGQKIIPACNTSCGMSETSERLGKFDKCSVKLTLSCASGLDLKKKKEANNG